MGDGCFRHRKYPLMRNDLFNDVWNTEITLTAPIKRLILDFLPLHGSVNNAVWSQVRSCGYHHVRLLLYDSSSDCEEGVQLQKNLRRIYMVDPSLIYIYEISFVPKIKTSNCFSFPFYLRYPTCD